MKFLSFIPLLFTPLLSANAIDIARSNTYLEYEGSAVTGIKSDYLDLEEYRVYSSYSEDSLNFTSISASFLNGNTKEATLMISNGITTIDENALEGATVSEIKFTGSKEEWTALNFVTSLDVTYYQCDEGFINYWNIYVRPEATSNICDVSEDTYNTLKSMYAILNASDRSVVDSYSDSANETIKDSMAYLKSTYTSSVDTSTETDLTTLEQETYIGIIAAISIFGMSSISIFYLFKRKGIIQ